MNRKLVMIMIICVLTASLVFFLSNKTKLTVSVSFRKTLEVSPLCVLKDSNSEKSSVKDYSNRFLFFFSQYHCNTCVSNQLSKIEEFQFHLDKDDMVLITDFQTDKELLVFMNNRNLKFDIFRTADDMFENNKERFHVPIIFIVDENMETQDFYLCEDTSGQKLRDFLEKNYNKIK